MSIDYSTEVVVGYVICVEEFFDKFLAKREERSHLEPRFDKRTGQPVEPERVIDATEGWDLVINGHTFEGPEDLDSDPNAWVFSDELIEYLQGELRCNVQFVGNHYHDCDFFLCLSPKELNVGGVVYSLDEVIASKDEVERIGARCRELGISPGPAGVHSVMSVA